MDRKSSIALAVLGFAFAANAAAADGNAQAGRQKASTCMGCHGIEGYRITFPEVYQVPKLGGQHSAYLVKALQGYKAGARNNATMRAIATSWVKASTLFQLRTAPHLAPSGWSY